MLVFLFKMLKVFFIVFKLMLILMFMFYFGYGYLSMYCYRKVQQSWLYMVVFCFLICLFSLLQCVVFVDKFKLVIFFFYIDFGLDGYFCCWDCFFVNSYFLLVFCNFLCIVFGKIIYFRYSLNNMDIIKSLEFVIFFLNMKFVYLKN